MALTHRSVSHKNNERLEFLGDAVLGFVIAETLYEKFPDTDEGKLTRLRAALVKRETLASIGREYELGKLLILGEGEKKSGGWRRDSILANTVEAILGAIYLDSDFNSTRHVLLNVYKDRLDKASVDDIRKDAKTELQEYLQGRKMALPDYEIISEQGKSHAKEFTVKCTVDVFDEPVLATGKSKRGAEQAVAHAILTQLKSMKNNR